MPARHHQRVTNAHRAAVCGLMLAGLSFGEGCRIVGVPYRLLHGLLGRDWWAKRGPPRGRGKTWHGERLERLRLAYGSPSQSVASIARDSGTTKDIVYSLAKRYGWPPRRPQKAHGLPVPVAEMTRPMRLRYLKVRAVLGRDAAIEEVFGTGSASRSGGAD